MFTRFIANQFKNAVTKYKAVTLIGPRQSGKTTLAKTICPDFEYYSLENPEHRRRSYEDPKGFLTSIKKSVIIDEVQRNPDLLSYLQEILDDKKDKRKFVLTGSNSLLLSDKISQSLAGRSRILHVLPLLRQELPKKLQPATISETLFMGSYPRIFDENLEPNEWYGDYVQTYLEKDVRTLINVENIGQFDRFLRITASRTGQLSNFSSLGSDVGISTPTAQKWFGVLQASYIAFTLNPHFVNFGKRIIKASKIYFFDTGLLCYLLRIQTPDQLENHPLAGAIFENWVVSEYYKKFTSEAKEPPLYFWRDQHGHEIDLILDLGKKLFPIEIKLSQTFHTDFINNILWFNELQKTQDGQVIYGGNKDFPFQNIKVNSWSEISFFE
ncbi:MAG: ATP-binding protein [Pseudobdellovibrionaceae bacterium]